MEEEIIIVGQEDNVIKIKEDASSGIKIKENVESITVDSEKPISIGVESAFPPLGEDNADLNHSKLYGRDLPNQHPIYAVEGLREELDAIEELQTVYSDKKQQANYYLWQDENLSQESRNGYFVCFWQGTDKIQKCNSKTDVFGVTVADAGFVGGQEYIQAPNGKKTGRDSAYGLVATIGNVGVRCESDVAVGDYVAPNTDGIAAKSNGNYGYLVTAIEDRNGVDYAIISLIAPSTLAKSLADDVQDIGKRMSNAEYNITAVGNTASAAYKLAHDTKESTSIDMDVLEEKVKEIIERTDNNENQTDRIEIDLGSLKQSVAQAKAQAQSAITSAETIRKEAVKKANDALTEAKKNGADLEAYQNIVANIDKYTVGEHSQAYDLTLAQAEQVLERGMVYVPTVGFDEEGYKNIEEYSTVYSQSFLRGYYYTWSGISWTPSTAVGVAFSSDGLYITGHENMPYWVIENEDVVHEGVTYPKDALYLWQNDKWNQQATISKNVINRTVALVRHTANEVAQEVTNARGSAATLNARLDEDGAKVSLVASVVTELKDVKPVDILKTIDELPETADIDAYYCVGISAPYDVYKYDGTEFKKELLIYYDGAHFCKVNTASIVSAVNNDGDSSISLSANKINFSGLSTFFSTDENGGITAINGSGITTGAIQSINYEKDVSGSKISLEDGTIDSKHFKVSSTGEITATSGNIGGCTIDEVNGLKVDAAHIISVNADVIDADSLSAITANLGTVNAGIVQSPNYVSGESGLKLDLNNGTADITGTIVAKEGKIGEITINKDGSINSKNNYFTVGVDGKVTATNADVKGTISANSGDIGGLSLGNNTLSSTNFKLLTLEKDTITQSILKFYDKDGNEATRIDDESIYANKIDTQSITTEKINTNNISVEKLNLAGKTISSSSSSIEFGGNGGDISYTAELSWSSNEFTVNVGKPLLYDTWFSISYLVVADIDGKYSTVRVMIPAGKEKNSVTVSAFFGIKDAYFCISNQNKGTSYNFVQSSGTSVINITGALIPKSTQIYNIGTVDYKWNAIYATTGYLNDAEILTSDINKKNTILSINEKYSKLFDMLNPVTFKFNEGESGRTHIGLIANDVKKSLDCLEIDTKDFAAYCSWQDSDGNETCGIRYGELISLSIYEIQKLKKHIVELEKEVKALKGEE